MSRKLAGIVVAGAFLLTLLPGSAAAADPDRRAATRLPDSVEQLKLADRVQLDGDAAVAAKVDNALKGVTGRQRVIVRLTARPAVEAIAQGPAAEASALKAAKAQQAAIISKAKSVDSKVTVLGKTGKASNVVMLKLSTKGIEALAKERSVAAIVPVRDYQLDLSETVPYVGGSIVQAKGFKGKGVDVVVFDTGIDYTHKAFGGAGTTDAFIAAYGEAPDDDANTVPTGFPTSRIKGGYDFTGEFWPDEDEAPDPDPIDSPDSGTELGVEMGTDGGHGTHVADIIGGTKGMAPQANLFIVKVCSSISTACSGVALMNAMDWAMDPNADGRMTDHVDVINMSLGSLYGTAYDDDLTLAVQRAFNYAGILTVAAAGNGENKPYVLDTPSAAPSALSVAQTQVPSAKTFPLVISAPPAIAGTYPNTETVDWAPLGDGFSGDVAFVGRGCPAESVDGTNPDDPYLADPDGKVALIDRGGCAISLKVDRAAKAGAVAVLIALIAPGDAVSFSYGGGEDFVPTLVIQQALGAAIKAQLAIPATVTASVSDATFIRLVGSMAGTSSRGPSSDNRLKPEIGAPGASVSAVSGSGDGTQAFGGTSGATPMVSGAAALLMSAFPTRSALEIKAVLQNTAEPTVYTNPALYPGRKAPITRIGGGELRVNRALSSPIAVWDATNQTGALSFGFVDGSKDLTVTRTLTVRNYTNKTLVYSIEPKFRYGNDQTNGAVKVLVRDRITLQPHQTRTFTVTMKLDASKLRDWTLNGGDNGINPAALDLMEYDGYVFFNQLGTKSDNARKLHVAWQVLPRKSGDVRVPGGTEVEVGDDVTLDNVGAGTAAVDVFSLVATSPDKPAARRGMNSPVIDLKAVGVQTFPVPADTACDDVDSFVYQVAVSNWERQTTAVVPGEIDLYIDTDEDGTADYNVFSAPLSVGALSDARAVTWVYDIDADALDAWFFTSHGTNDSNTILTFCGDQIGLDAEDFGTPLTMDVVAYDWYYRDYAVTDSITDIEVAPLAEHFGWLADFPTDIDPGDSGVFTVDDWSQYYEYDANPSEIGLLLITNGDRGDYRGGAPVGREQILLMVDAPI